MKKLTTIFFLIAFQQFNYANDSLPGRKIIYHTKIATADGKKIQAYLANINDSSVNVTNEPLHFGSSTGKENIPYSNISYLNLRKKGSGGKGAVIGALTGLGVGVIIGLASGSEPVKPWQIIRFTAVDKALGLGLGLGLTGALTGALFGALSDQVFQINKKKENFQQMKTNILDKVYGSSHSR